MCSDVTKEKICVFPLNLIFNCRPISYVKVIYDIITKSDSSFDKPALATLSTLRPRMHRKRKKLYVFRHIKM